MATFLDLSDIGITISGLDDTPQQSAGYAYLPKDSDPLFGYDAIAVAKLHPTQINNRFWADLNTEPSSPTHPKVRHHADLAWFHLKNLKPSFDATDVKMIVPSSYDEEALQLLAGVCQSLEINVTAFINRAVASCINYADDQTRFTHVDLQQHQTLLTFLEVQDGRLQITEKDQIPATGLIRMQDRWLHVLRQRYITGSRFDPMHSGETEQQLFSQLNEFIADGEKDKFEFTIALDDQNLQQSFSVDEFTQPYKDLLTEIRAKTGDAPLVLDSYFASLPGVNSSENITVAAPKSSLLGAQQLLKSDVNSGDEIAYLSSAQMGGTEPHQVTSNDTNATLDTKKLPATHILIQGFAYAGNHCHLEVDETALRLVKDNNPDHAHFRYQDEQLELGPRGFELQINQSAGTEGDKLYPGDIISLGKGSEPITAIALKGMDK